MRDLLVHGVMLVHLAAVTAVVPVIRGVNDNGIVQLAVRFQPIQHSADGIVDLRDPGVIPRHNGRKERPILVLGVPVDALLPLNVGLILIRIRKAVPYGDVCGIVHVRKLLDGCARQVRLGKFHLQQPRVLVLPCLHKRNDMPCGLMRGRVLLIHIVHLPPKAVGGHALRIMLRHGAHDLGARHVHVVAHGLRRCVVATLPGTHPAGMIAKHVSQLPCPRLAVRGQHAGIDLLIVVPKCPDLLCSLAGQHALPGRTAHGNGAIAACQIDAALGKAVNVGGLDGVFPGIAKAIPSLLIHADPKNVGVLTHGILLSFSII